MFDGIKVALSGRGAAEPGPGVPHYQPVRLITANGSMSSSEELKRCNVVRVGAACCVLAWALAQVAGFAFETFGAPDRALKTLVVALLTGLPIALFLAWVFELTPEGMRCESELDAAPAIARTPGHILTDFLRDLR